MTAATDTALQRRPTDGLRADTGAEHATALRNEVQAEQRDKGVVHLAYVDGLRGFLALYIVLHHMAGAIGLAHGWFVWTIAWGGYCVAMFITISGFCLMLPVTRAGNVLRGGARRFYWKRIRRILPPYYVALLLSVLLYPALSAGKTSFADLLHPPYLRAIGMHLLLLHNWADATKYAFNGPLWSVAVECQIYVLFPLLVLLWRRLRAPLAVGCIGVVALAATVLLGYRGNVHYLLLFALGMWAAECAGNPARLRRSGSLLLLFAVGLVVGTLRLPLLADVSVGALTALLLAREATESHSVVRRALTWRPLRAVGLFSYSLYLVHDVPLLLLGLHQGPLAQLSPGWRFLVCTVTAVPLLLVLAYLFYLLFERPFISHHAKTAVAQEKLGSAPA